MHSGMKAHLDIKYEVGKDIVKLTTEVELPPPQTQVQSKNGPEDYKILPISSAYAYKLCYIILF